MKNIPFLAALLLAFSGSLASAQSQKTPSKEFERMKTLEGTWAGKMDMGKGPMDIKVEFHVLAAGTAVEERDFAGSPHEMVTMYRDQHGKLEVTHYCSLGNAPAMLLKSSDAKSLTFDLDKKCGIEVKSEQHMHALTITFDDPDTITQSWTMFENGKSEDPHSYTLKRVKS
jgi:hypothetical protein